MDDGMLSQHANGDKAPNKPKRPMSAFLFFLKDFRKEFKESHPDSKRVKAVSKAGSNRWNEMSEEERAPYLEKAAERKAEYEKSLAMYKNRMGVVEEGLDGASANQSNKRKAAMKPVIRKKGHGPPKKDKEPFKKQNEPNRFHVDLHAESDENDSDD